MKIVIPSAKGLRGVDSKNIIYCQADNNYTKINLTNKRFFLATIPLKNIEQILCSSNFFRCQKSYLVNLDFFEELDFSHNQIILVENLKVKFSRNIKKTIKKTIFDYIQKCNSQPEEYISHEN